LPAIDQCQKQVLNALSKAGWQVLKAPSRISTVTRTVFIDARLGRGSNGTGEQILLLEVKCFADSGDRTMQLYECVGQYLVYRAILADTANSTPLYLSIPTFIVEEEFDTSIRRVIAESEIKVIVIDLDQEVVVQWNL
jgi:hypothetical protein